MPRIEKIRLVGVKYDSMRKHYEDTTLDLMNGTEPAHALLTLMNGGGKGLLLQMIFQLLMPLGRWGAKGENRVEALFYNERKQFMPYTFHVALEWRLDTDPVKWLTTGIAVSAREKASAAETEFDTAEPHYLLYTLEQIKPGNYELEELPLYDSANRRAVSLEELRAYLGARRADFTTYSKSQSKDYYEYLKSYDIDRKEWETLRNVNRQEGGVEAFFNKGQDNRSLFHDLIIPEIGKHMAGTDEEGNPGTLLDIFKHNAAIVQHLPKLMKREEGYRLLLQGLEPVMASLEEGAELEGREREHQRRGALVRHALGEWLGEQTKEKQQWQRELAMAEEEARELGWRGDNLEFAEKHREVAGLERVLSVARAALGRKQEQLADSRELEKRAAAIVLWNERDQALREETRLRQELELLQGAEEHRQVHEEQERVKGELVAEWSEVSAGWARALERYERLMRRLEREKAESERASRLLQEQLQEKAGLLGQVTGYLKTLNEEKLEMGREFGRLVNEAPEKLAEQLMKQLDSLRDQLKVKEQERQAAEQEKEALLERVAERNGWIRQASVELRAAERSWQERLEREKQAGARLAVFMRDAAAGGGEELGELLAGARLLEGQHRLGKELERLDAELSGRQQQLWTHQLDSSLAKQSYWIPNQELSKLHSELEAQGVPSHYGSELLASLTEEERADYLLAYPLLPYSLIVLEAAWKKREPRKMSQLLLRSPVPVYVREAMTGAGIHAAATPAVAEGATGVAALADGAFLLVDAGTELVRSPERWESWKRELAAQNEQLLEQIRLLKEWLEQGRELEQELKELAGSDDSAALGRRVEQLERQQQELEQQRLEAEENKRLVMQRLEQIAHEWETASKEAAELKPKLEKAAGWRKRLEQGDAWQRQKQAINQEIADKQQEQRARAERSNALGEEQYSWRQARQTWQNEQERTLEHAKRYAGEIQFSFQQTTAGIARHTGSSAKANAADATDTARGDLESGSDDADDIFAVVTGQLQRLTAQLDVLSASLEEKDRKLTEVRIHLKYATEAVVSKERELDTSYEGWREAGLTAKPLDIARSEHAVRVAESQAAERERQAAENRTTRLEGRLEGEKRGLSKLDADIRRKHQRASDAWENEELALLRAEWESSSARNRRHLAECRTVIDQVDRTLILLDKQQTVLASQRLSSEAIFDLPDEIRRSVRRDAAAAVTQWVEAMKRLSDSLTKLDREVAEQRNRFVKLIGEQSWDEELSGSLQQMIGQIRWDEYSYARELLLSVKEHAMFELDSLAADKSKAEQARDLWTDRACYRVISICKALRQMTNRMSFVNQGGHKYPLIRMDLRGGDLPEKPEEIRLLLQEYFVRTIDELSVSFPEITSAPDAELDKRMSDSQIVLTALRNRYPTLHVYKPQTTNVFLYESPKKHHYTEWETLNKGSVNEAKGSGGQLLAARTIVMMMLMTHKRQLRQTKMWSVLILDNPFGQAVSPHVLDPIFAIAENLCFQWIVLAPPELIKLDVSRRFPVFWELELKRQEGGETVTERLQHGGRTFEGEFDLFAF